MFAFRLASKIGFVHLRGRSAALAGESELQYAKNEGGRDGSCYLFTKPALSPNSMSIQAEHANSEPQREANSEPQPEVRPLTPPKL